MCSRWASVGPFLQGPVPSLPPPMNGTIGHFNNKQHMLLEFSNSQQYRTALCRSIQGTLLCNGSQWLCRCCLLLGADVALRLLACCPPLFLGLVWVPNPGKSVGPGVTRWAGPAPNLLLSDCWWLICQLLACGQKLNQKWTLNNHNPLIRSVSFSLTVSELGEEIFSGASIPPLSNFLRCWCHKEQY